MTTTHSHTDDDLLLAVRYVLNECDSAELAEFEARLADDGQAQAALVEAVQIVALLQATPTCEELAPRLPRPVPAQRSWQVASFVAATLLMVVIVVWQSSPFSQIENTPIDHTVAMTHESPALAQAWTALDSPSATFEDTDEAPATDDSSDEIASDVPDWLLTAVLVEAEQGASDENDQSLEEEIQL